MCWALWYVPVIPAIWDWEEYLGDSHTLQLWRAELAENPRCSVCSALVHVSELWFISSLIVRMMVEKYASNVELHWFSSDLYQHMNVWRFLTFKEQFNVWIPYNKG